MLSIRGYEKSYGSVPVLRIPHLALNHGVYHMTGENGSGKTTLLKSVAGITPFKGTIAVAGCDIRRQRMQYRKWVAFAEAEPLYPPFLTGFDLIDFYARTKGGPRAVLLECAGKLGVDRFMHQRIDTYSSGMVKKLSLALAFAGHPRLVLLDEPLITLDTEAVATVQQLIAAFYNAGTGFVLTSHQPLDLPVLCQRLYLKDQTLHA